MNSEKNCDNSGSICKYSTIPFKCVNELTAEKLTAETSEEKTCLARQVAVSSN